MRNEQIDQALGEAKSVLLDQAPHLDFHLSKCSVAAACQAFLDSLAKSSGWPISAVLRTAHGAITKWRAANGC